ncbi:MAG: hypothetical protein E7292_03475 [Lachnospiraceae bacterium]|nr:hypothetical protein [Lachnospiraceae bacterium]
MKNLILEKALKIGIPVLGIVLLLGVIAGISSCVEDSNTIPMEAEAVIGGLEWGMSMEEAQQVLSSKSNYHKTYPIVLPQETEGSQYMVYDIEDYQGIAGADMEMNLIFYDNQLIEGWYELNGPTTSGDGPKCSTKGLKELRKGFRKTYRDSSEDAYDNYARDDGTFYVGEESLVEVYSWENIYEKEIVQVFVDFQDVDAPFSQKLIEQLK